MHGEEADEPGDSCLGLLKIRECHKAEASGTPSVAITHNDGLEISKKIQSDWSYTIKPTGDRKALMAQNVHQGLDQTRRMPTDFTQKERQGAKRNNSATNVTLTIRSSKTRT